ncbi:NADPH-dependent FMN reductase [Pseudoduganella namucuonensis]|uniref:FMN reductase n=1 Tax=Pseudoduganella namucuonensis TaxID=1035707 RepID=A0A1I7GQB4_9BURK|nr:NADPH-dependent FMN reductase [Pseudoduganella namucuonensis]SFU50426.1 FMN reductase [Pseudoduganella namucuonensis]
MSILLLGGSPSLPSSSSRLLLHIGDRLAAQGQRYHRLHVRDLPPRALLHGDTGDSAIRRAIEAVAEAEAIVIATPVYKASYSGVLKAFLDLLPREGLAGKIVLPIATGGTQSHMLALDYALRPVLQALSVRQVLTSIYATSQQLEWHSDLGLALAPPVAAKVTAGLGELTAALAAARRERPESPERPAPAIAPRTVPARTLQDPPYTPALAHA